MVIKIILLDLSAIAISNILVKEAGETTPAYLDKNYSLHKVFNSIKGYKQLFSHEFGEMVVCCDTFNSWRYGIFPQYKATRKALKASSGIDWDAVGDIINDVKDALKKNFKYKTIEVPDAEADDIIATLSKFITEKTVIVSKDKDFGQLQKYPHVSQFCPSTKEFIVIKNPERHLQELIIHGDRGDGIPSIRNPATIYVTKTRALPVSEKNIDKWIAEGVPPEFQEYYNRNEQLISFEKIPAELRLTIIEEYVKKPIGNKQLMFKYFQDNNMRKMMMEVGKF